MGLGWSLLSIFREDVAVFGTAGSKARKDYTSCLWLRIVLPVFIHKRVLNRDVTHRTVEVVGM